MSIVISVYPRSPSKSFFSEMQIFSQFKMWLNHTKPVLRILAYTGNLIAFIYQNDYTKKIWQTKQKLLISSPDSRRLGDCGFKAFASDARGNDEENGNIRRRKCDDRRLFGEFISFRYTEGTEEVGRKWRLRLIETTSLEELGMEAQPGQVVEHRRGANRSTWVAEKVPLVEVVITESIAKA